MEFAARDPFLSVSIESFVSARFQRVISRGKFDRSDDNSLLCPRLLLYSFVYSPPPPPLRYIKRYLSRCITGYIIGFCIIHRSKRTELVSRRAFLPSFLPCENCARDIYDSARTFKGNDGNSIDIRRSRGRLLPFLQSMITRPMISFRKPFRSPSFLRTKIKKTT